MNETQFGGLLRAVFAGLGGYVVAKGWFPLELVNGVIGGAVVIGIAVWSWYTNKTSAMAAAAVADEPDSMVVAVAESPKVKEVVMTSVAAASATPALAATANVVGPRPTNVTGGGR